MRRATPWLLIALTVGAALLFVNRAGLWLEASGQAPRYIEPAADLVVVMGGGTGERVLRAAELVRDGSARYALFTGVGNGHPRLQVHVIDASVALARAEGIAEERMRFDPLPRNTWEEARAALGLMRANGWQRVLVVSDPPHARRIAYTWRQVFEGSGLHWQVVNAPSDWWDPQGWWRSERGVVWVLSEWLKLAYYRIARST